MSPCCRLCFMVLRRQKRPDPSALGGMFCSCVSYSQALVYPVLKKHPYLVPEWSSIRNPRRAPPEKSEKQKRNGILKNVYEEFSRKKLWQNFRGKVQNKFIFL